MQQQRSSFPFLPERPGLERDNAIMKAIEAGQYSPIVWAEVKAQAGPHKATFLVSADALQICDDNESVRVNASARLAQRIADTLGCLLPTPRICDLVWEQAVVKIPPSLQKPDANMGDTSRMLQHHRAVEEKRNGRDGLLENVGKHWVLTNRLKAVSGRGANYGWYDKTAPYKSVNGTHPMWQSLGLAHDLDHVDYSQVVRLVSSKCIVNDVTMEVVDVLRDPTLHALISHEGPITSSRLPGV